MEQPELEPQPPPAGGQADNRQHRVQSAQALMQTHFPTYQQDLTGSRLLPRDVVEHLKRTLPPEDYERLMDFYSEPGSRDNAGNPDNFTVMFQRKSQPGPQLLSVRVAKLCENKKVMAVLYSLLASGEVRWEYGEDFMNYVHVLESDRARGRLLAKVCLAVGLVALFRTFT